jgi:two-component system sensor histidine kinase RcsD
VLVNKKLKQAQRLYEKNQQGRAAFMQNIAEALKQPVKALAGEAAALSDKEGNQLADHAEALARLVDEINWPICWKTTLERTIHAVFHSGFD